MKFTNKNGSDDYGEYRGGALDRFDETNSDVIQGRKTKDQRCES